MKDSAWGSVGRAVTSDTRDLRFKSSLWQNLWTINSIEKSKTKKRGREWSVFKKARILSLFTFCNKNSNLHSIDRLPNAWLKCPYLWNVKTIKRSKWPKSLWIYTASLVGMSNCRQFYTDRRINLGLNSRTLQDGHQGVFILLKKQVELSKTSTHRERKCADGAKFFSGCYGVTNSRSPSSSLSTAIGIILSPLIALVGLAVLPS